VLESGPSGTQNPLGPRLADDADYASEYEFRAGGYVLSLLAKALNDPVLRALSDGPLRLADLRKAVGGPAQTTLRGNLGNLLEIGALEKVQANGRPSALSNALTPVGRDLLAVSDTLVAWLESAADGPIALESETGKAAVKALVGGWGSTMLRALAARPLSLTELDNLINAFSYPALERRLGAMRLSGQVKPARRGNGGGTPYAVTGWLRRGVAPLLSAVRCERRHMGEATAPLTKIDVETVLLLAVPLLDFPPKASGSCQLVATGGTDASWRSAGVHLTVERGRLAACTSKLDAEPDGAVSGPAIEWLDALVGGKAKANLEVRGDRALALDVVDGLHRALFAR